MKRQFFFLALFALTGVLLTFRSAASVHAASTINVTTNLDEFDRSGTGQGCSLREAIYAAEYDKAFGGCPKGSGDDTIMLQATTYTNTREFDPQGGSGSFYIASNVTVQGAANGSTIIDGGGNSIGRSVFVVSGQSQVTFNRLTVRNGITAYLGGGFDIGPRTEVTINDSIIRNNRSAQGGGGIFNDGDLRLNNVIVRNNDSTGVGGGIANRKHENYPAPSLQLKDSSVNDNTSESQGGGIFNQDATLTLINTSVNTNSAGANGGGIWNGGTANVRFSTISNNSAHAGGGGIETYEFLNVVNSTISSNRARYNGGGVSNYGVAEFYSATIASNVADSDWNNNNDGGGGIFSTTQTAVVRNTIIADNRNLDSLLTEHKDDCKGHLLLEYNSLLESADDCTLHIHQTNSILYQDPKLEALADNGGPTQTHALKSNSPAIDKGNSNGCKDADATTLTADQRGYFRTINGDNLGGARCDIGAFEYGSIALPLPTLVFTPTPTKTATPVNTLPPPATNTPIPIFTPAPSATPTNTPSNGQCSSKPNAPTLQAPTNAALITKTKVNLAWSDVNCATKYKVRVRMDSKKGMVTVRKTLTLTQYKTERLERGHTYFWKVLACNAYGCGKAAFYQFSIQ